MVGQMPMEGGRWVHMVIPQVSVPCSDVFRFEPKRLGIVEDVVEQVICRIIKSHQIRTVVSGKGCSRSLKSVVPDQMTTGRSFISISLKSWWKKAVSPVITAETSLRTNRVAVDRRQSHEDKVSSS